MGGLPGAYAVSSRRSARWEYRAARMSWDLRHRKSSLVIRVLLAGWITVVIVVLCATGRWWGLVFVVPLVLDPVSYTHLDVYKRQVPPSTSSANTGTARQRQRRRPAIVLRPLLDTSTRTSRAARSSSTPSSTSTRGRWLTTLPLPVQSAARALPSKRAAHAKPWPALSARSRQAGALPRRMGAPRRPAAATPHAARC